LFIPVDSQLNITLVVVIIVFQLYCKYIKLFKIKYFEVIMPLEYKEIKKNAKLLPKHKRADLIHELINTLDDSTDKEIQNEWDIEIKKRVDEIKSGKAIGRLAEEIHAEIQAKYS
jgi:hypothetical protein